jgi:hypothetical protein
VSILSGDGGLDRKLDCGGCRLHGRRDRIGNQESCSGPGREQHLDKHIIEGGSQWLAR